QAGAADLERMALERASEYDQRQAGFRTGMIADGMNGVRNIPNFDGAMDNINYTAPELAYGASVPMGKRPHYELNFAVDGGDTRRTADRDELMNSMKENGIDQM